ncbi:unnamed protein product [Darwinula stevensoni]|uniref:Uncharacterized protein n=1 Tax=Darwinula stevensoni TaxID=69355 RepID=A0A7R9A2P3_9CRUS|nr:unnamed protein product [Darwinula stevensoni]CAG0890110.1 unnamed protein product [Darwinula stevensoni]
MLKLLLIIAIGIHRSSPCGKVDTQFLVVGVVVGFIILSLAHLLGYFFGQKASTQVFLDLTSTPLHSPRTPEPASLRGGKTLSEIYDTPRPKLFFQGGYYAALIQKSSPRLLPRTVLTQVAMDDPKLVHGRVVQRWMKVQKRSSFGCS